MAGEAGDLSRHENGRLADVLADTGALAIRAPCAHGVELLVGHGTRRRRERPHHDDNAGEGEGCDER